MKIGNRILDIHNVTIKDLKDYDVVSPNRRGPYICRLEELQKQLKKVEIAISIEEHHNQVLSNDIILYKEQRISKLRKQLLNKHRERIVLEIQQVLTGYEYLIIDEKISQIV